MTDFTKLPKQWIVSERSPGEVLRGQEDSFAGRCIQAADGVPILRITSFEGQDIGRLIGWVIDGATFHRKNGELRLPVGVTPENFFVALSGRFVMLWRTDDGRLLLREDSAGSLPAVYSGDLRAVASTVTAMETFNVLELDTETIALFDFPARRGFLPFGLTSRRGVQRLMANHALNLGDFSSHRIWPNAEFCLRPELSDAEVPRRVSEVGSIVRNHMRAILTQGETVLYLSGGHDSRMVLAAASGLAGELRSETLDTKNGLDAYLSSRLARIAGIPNQRIEVQTAPPGAVADWLHRSGYSVYDFVSEIASTMLAHAPRNHPLSGTGAELTRATNWAPEDVGARSLDVDTLLQRLRMPASPAVRRAGQLWLDGLSSTHNATMILDLCKIEQIHGCWAGASIYGHPMPLPSIHPFSGQDFVEIALSLPKEYRMKNLFFRDYMEAFAPHFLEVPVNKAVGLDRLRFWKHELNQMLPNRIKRRIKPFR